MDNTPQENSENNENIAVINNNDNKKKKGKFVKEEITEENCKFEEGQILKFTRVRFPGHARSYAFLVGNRNLQYGQKVVAMSDRGMAVGYINSFSYELPFSKDMLPLRSINKIATEEDITKEKDVYKRQKEIETTCQSLIDKHKLDMNLTHVEFTQFGKKVVFYFVAPARVDFRGLVKDLVSDLKLRIELRQISVRDRAASMGAIGPCGRELCCSSFLSKYGNVAIKMAKNQNLTLNYSKLNGVCGQLKCCLQYEDEVYTNKRKKLPNEGEIVKTRTGDIGKIKKLNILSEQFDMITNKGQIKRYTYDQIEKKIPKSEAKFPDRFDNISDETATVIGQDYQETKKVRQFERDMEKIKKRAKNYAQERMNELSDDLPIEKKEIDYSEPEEKKETYHSKKRNEETQSISSEKTISETGEVNSDDKSSSEQRPRRNNRNPRHNKKKNFRPRNNQKDGDSKSFKKKPYNKNKQNQSHAKKVDKKDS